MRGSKVCQPDGKPGSLTNFSEVTDEALSQYDASCDHTIKPGRQRSKEGFSRTSKHHFVISRARGEQRPDKNTVNKHFLTFTFILTAGITVCSGTQTSCDIWNVTLLQASCYVECSSPHKSNMTQIRFLLCGNLTCTLYTSRESENKSSEWGKLNSDCRVHCWYWRKW